MGAGNLVNKTLGHASRDESLSDDAWGEGEARGRVAWTRVLAAAHHGNNTAYCSLLVLAIGLFVYRANVPHGGKMITKSDARVRTMRDCAIPV